MPKGLAADRGVLTGVPAHAFRGVWPGVLLGVPTPSLLFTPTDGVPIDGHAAADEVMKDANLDLGTCKLSNL